MNHKMNNAQLSDANPKRIYTTVQFSIRSLFIIFIIGFFTSAFHTHFLFQQVNGVMEILYLSSLLIYLVGFVGFFKAMQIIAIYSVDTSISKDVDDWVNKKYTQIQLEQVDSLTIKTIQQRIPDNKSPELQMRNLFNEILKEAREERYGTSAIITQPYKENAALKIFDVINFQKISLQLGILGTFIGLILAFINLKFGNFELALADISNALQFSFHTSIAGLISSILLAFSLAVIRKKQEVFFYFMEKSTNSLIRLVRHPYIENDIKLELKNVSKNIEKLISNVKILSQDIRENNKLFSENIIYLNEFLEELNDSYQDFLINLKDSYKILLPETIKDDLRKNLENAVSGISEALENNLTSTIRKYQTIFQSITDMNTILQNQSQMIKDGSLQVELTKKEVYENQKKFLVQLTEANVNQQLVNSVSKVGNQLSTSINGGSENLAVEITKYEKQLNEFNNFIVTKYEREKRQSRYIFICSIIFGIIGVIATILTVMFPDFLIGIFQRNL